MGKEARTVDAELSTPADIAEFLKSRRTPRKRATQKLEDVLRRLADGDPPLDRVRNAWVLGSYARGAPDVGDVDLLLEIDEARSRQEQGLQSYYRRAHPYAEVVSALGCGSGSIVNVDVQPVFLEGEPMSADPVPEPEQPPMLAHAVTGQPFEPAPALLWLRGDGFDTARERLGALPEDPNARRFERTTTVPLLDDLTHLLSVETAFLLAAQVRKGNIELEPILLHAGSAPPSCEEALERRYSPKSTRRAASAAALQHLADQGIDLKRVILVDQRATRRRRHPNEENAAVIRVDFNAFELYRLGSGSYHDGWRHLHVWPRSKAGPWLGLHVRVINSEATSNLFHHLNTIENGRAGRSKRMRETLGLDEER
jgi:hypothetical protein